MRYMKSRILLYLFIIHTSFMLCPRVFASSCVIQTSPSSSFENESFWNNLALKLLEEEPANAPIHCFDVSTDGKIALGFDGSNNDKTISVYSAENEFLFGYTFQCYGSFYVFWQQENICMYFVRSKEVAIVDPSGNGVAVFDAPDMGINSERLKDIQSPTKELDGNQYTMERDVILGDKYGRLCVTNSDGIRRVLYDATKLHNARVVLGTFCTVSFMCVAAYFAVKRYKTEKMTRDGGRTGDGGVS